MAKIPVSSKRRKLTLSFFNNCKVDKHCMYINVCISFCTPDMVPNEQSKHYDASSEDWLGMIALCLITCVPVETLIAAYAMNRDLVFAIGQIKCIKGIRLKAGCPTLFAPVESTLAGACWTPTGK